MNLFVSFILRAMAVISKEIILYIMYSNLPKDDPGWNSYSSSTVLEAPPLFTSVHVKEKSDEPNDLQFTTFFSR